MGKYISIIHKLMVGIYPEKEDAGRPCLSRRYFDAGILPLILERKGKDQRTMIVWARLGRQNNQGIVSIESEASLVILFLKTLAKANRR